MIVGAMEIQLAADVAKLTRDMNAARQVVGNATDSMARAARMAMGALGAIGGALSISAFSGWIRGAIDVTDAASDLSQKTGIAIKDLAGLQLAYQKGGMEAGALATTQARLSKAMVDGNKALDAMGISSKNLDGSMKSNKDVLYETAERFAGMQDGAQKTALALEIFGKSGADMIPMLNEGSTGLRDMEEMATKLGLTLSDKTVEQAGAFNDTLDLLQLGGQGVARGIASELLPTLNSLAGSFLTSMTEGDKLAKTAAFLGSTMKILYTVGVGVVEVFSTVGKVLGGVMAGVTTVLGGYANVLGKLIKGDFTGAFDAVKSAVRDSGTVALAVGADVMAGWKSTAQTIASAWDGSGAAAVESMSKINKSTVLAIDNTKALAKAAKDAEAARLKEQKAIADAAAAAIKIQSDYAAKLGQSVAEANREADANEELARTFGMSKVAIEAETIAKMERRVETLRGIEQADDAIAALELEIAARKRNAAALGSLEAQAASKKATEDIAADYKRMSESIESSLTDALLRGFESGKSFGRNLVDTLKNMFKTLILQPTIKGILAPVTGGLASAMMPGAAQAASGSGGGTAVASGLSSALGIGGSMAAFGGTLATGFMSTMTGVGLSTSLGAGASMMAGGSIASGLGMVAGALGPIALALAAAVLIWKKLDTSGTYHTGGASSASASGVSTIRAESLGMAETRITSATNELTASLASGMVKILDSTAQAFGKTAGYEAATAFADDTSKDGAWGALVIKKMGETVLDWNNGRAAGSWAPKEFGDGEAGQKEYLAALSASVRTALDDIGLPSWAQTMLDGLGNAPSIEDLAKVVDTINATQGALKLMGENLKGFADLSDGAVSALMKAAGGIESLSSSASAYYDNFYTESERSAGAMKQVSDSLAAVGLAMPASREAFRAMVEAQMALGESGMPAVAALFKVSEEFARLHPVMESVDASAQGLTTALEAQADAMQAVKDQASGLLDGVDASMAVLQRVINTEKSRIAEAHAVTMNALQERIDTESAAIAKHKSLSDAIGSTLDQMRGAAGGMDRADAQAQVAAALATARAGGALPSADSLKGALSALSKDSTAQFATLQDYQRDFFRTQGDLAALGAISDTALSIEEKSLAALIAQKDIAQKSYDAEVMRLDAIVTGAQQQIDVLRGIDTTGLSIKQALDALAGSILAAQKNPLAGSGALINDAYKSALGRAPDAAGSQFWQDKIASGTPVSSVIGAINGSQEAQVQALYKQLLGRSADAGGLNYFMSSGASMDAIRNALMQSDEYKRRVPGFAAGGDFGGGLRIVGENGPELEATGPSRIFNARQTSQMLGGDNSELVAAVERLTVTVKQQQAALDKIAGSSKRTADTLEVVTEGGSAMRTAA